ncbi:hypothetical protein [Oscillibacter sp.]|uniref:hypothetical protein n=1 Tax=Oscillibacter sp. TaxID=1945593 RepID=UPI00339AD6E8
MTSDCLIVRYSAKLRSIDLMDSFERCNEQQEPLYNKLLLQDIFTILIDGTFYRADILITRKPYEMPWCNIGITFTTLRKQVAYHTFTLDDMDEIDPVSQTLAMLRLDKQIREITLNPVILKAQNSRNRNGYGSSFHGRQLSRPGTLYGETTPYLIQKIYLHE